MDNNINRVLKSACLGYNSDNTDDETDNSLQDVIEHTPQNSPISFLQVGFLTSSILRKFLRYLTEFKAFYKTGNQLDLVRDISYEPGEQSIEAPAYSPLTPLMKLGEGSVKHLGLPLINSPSPSLLARETSCEDPLASPLNPSNSPSASDCGNVNPRCSPLPPMSPKTKNLLHVLEGWEDSDDCAQEVDYHVKKHNDASSDIRLDFIENDKENGEDYNENNNLPIGGKISGTIETDEINATRQHARATQSTTDQNNDANVLEGWENSDDSVQDPDYQVEKHNNVSSDTTLDSILNDNDNGEDYNENLPIGEEINERIDNEEINETRHDVRETQSTTDRNNDADADEERNGRPRKGRKRKYGQLSREERKQKKYKNEPYVNYKKQLVNPKIFIDYACGCSKKCQEKVSVEIRRTEFEKFYNLGSYQAQNMYIVACVKEEPVKRPYLSQNVSFNKKKTFTRHYFLKGISVCRPMFVETIQTTPKRVDSALKKMRTDCTEDRRGLSGGSNKISTERKEFFTNIIKKLPTYVSHYCREKVGEAKYLRPDLNFSKIYQLYEEKAKSARVKSMSYSKAKNIFLTEFNLRTKPLNKDTCNKCDFFKNKIELSSTEDEKIIIVEEHMTHLKIAEDLKKRMKSDMALAKNDPCVETITFDLEKTLPLPRIPTNIVFYKRQLWMYNLGIHTGSDDVGYCNIWMEGEAGRGSQEVASCLIKHLSEKLKAGVTHLILWSDSCGGQNRNIKITLMLKAFLNDHPTLQKINMRFLESGHSFLPNDTDFGKIESALKYQQRIYLPEDYMTTMRTCKKTNPLQVQRMLGTDFFGSRKLENITTNRKKAVTGEKISWLKTKEILLKKEEMYSLFLSCTLDGPYAEVDLKKNNRGRQRPLSRNMLEVLWPNGKPIPMAKLNDIKSLMHLIPRDAHSFYKRLTGDETVEDDIEGFTGEPDYEVEDDVLE